jgi:hypothetical protein
MIGLAGVMTCGVPANAGLRFLSKPRILTIS